MLLLGKLAHMLLKADPTLEGNVADDKADPSSCHQLGTVSVLQYFRGNTGSMEHHHVFRQARLSWQVLSTVVTLFWQTGQGGKWQVIWCLGSQHIIHDVGFLCISTMLFVNFFFLKNPELVKTLNQELQKWQLGPRGILLSCPPAPPSCPGYPFHPSLSPPSSPHHHQPPSSPLPPPLSPPF